MNVGRCSQCGGPRQPKAVNPAFPFCSGRCKWLDLSKWLSGEYRIPVGFEETERDSPSAIEVQDGHLRDSPGDVEEVN